MYTSELLVTRLLGITSSKVFIANPIFFLFAGGRDGLTTGGAAALLFLSCPSVFSSIVRSLENQTLLWGFYRNQELLV
jgi:hypothetical protein